MDFTEKLRRASRDLNKAKAARDVGLKENTFSSYIAVGSVPRADIALKIAKALGVPLDWLVDDSKGWPPPESASPSLSVFSDKALVLEVLRRRRLIQVAWADALDVLESVDWADVKRRLKALSPEEQLPIDLRKIAFAMHNSNAALMNLMMLFHLDHMESMSGDDLPVEGREPGELVFEHLNDRHTKYAANVNKKDIYADLMSRTRVA